MNLPNDVRQAWPPEFHSEQKLITELKRLREAGGSSPATEVDLADGRRVRIELPYDRDELIVTEIEKEPEEVS